MENRKALLSIVAIYLFRGAASTPFNSSRPSVTLSSGVVVGTTTLLPAATAPVNKYLGIPFAASPPERFSPPIEPAVWDTPLDASSYRSSCIQQFNDPPAARQFTVDVFNNPFGPPIEESEDCLYLNVFTPSTLTPCTRRAVMFWIFGGGLQFGSGGLHYYDGSSFAADQDVIIVTANYRTNVFGFSNSPDIPFGKQNAGFLDQRKALSWVTQNIAAFGGDPDRVTLFGESAGGYSVKQLLALPPSPLPYHAAILESEAEFLAGNSTANWLTLVDHFNCTSTPSQTRCMRSTNASEIKSFIETQALNFLPVFDNVTVTTDVRLSIRSSSFAHVPVLIGTNSQEGTAIAAPLHLTMPDLTDEEFVNMAYPDRPELQSSILDAYTPQEKSRPYGLPALVYTDGFFMCPASMVANMASANGYDFWRYYYNASFPNTQVFPNAGVYHYSEILEVWGTYPRENATLEEARVSRYMQTTWADFAKDPSKGPGWPRIGTNGGKELVVIGDRSGTIATVALNSTDFICSVYAAYLNEVGI